MNNNVMQVPAAIAEVIRARVEEVLAQEAGQELQAETERAIENDKREALFSLIDDDPVAVALVKVYLAVRVERSGYAERIAGMSDKLYDMDAHLSRKLEEERKRTDAARRERWMRG